MIIEKTIYFRNKTAKLFADTANVYRLSRWARNVTI